MNRIALFLCVIFSVGCSSPEQARSKLEDYVKFLAVNATALNEAIIYQSENSSYLSFVVYAETVVPKSQLLPGEPGYESPVASEPQKKPSKSEGGIQLDYLGGIRAARKERKEMQELAIERARRSLVRKELEKQFCSARLSDLMRRQSIDQVTFILDDPDSIQFKFVCEK